MTGKHIFIFISLIFIAMSIKKTKDDVIAAAKKKKASKKSAQGAGHQFFAQGSKPQQKAQQPTQQNQ